MALRHILIEAVTRGVPWKVFLEIAQNSQENPCARVSFSKNLQAIKKEPRAQEFFSKFFEISGNIFFLEHLWTSASI